MSQQARTTSSGHRATIDVAGDVARCIVRAAIAGLGVAAVAVVFLIMGASGASAETASTPTSATPTSATPSTGPAAPSVSTGEQDATRDETGGQDAPVAQVTDPQPAAGQQPEPTQQSEPSEPTQADQPAPPTQPAPSPTTHAPVVGSSAPAASPTDPAGTDIPHSVQRTIEELVSSPGSTSTTEDVSSEGSAADGATESSVPAGLPSTVDQAQQPGAEVAEQPVPGGRPMHTGEIPVASDIIRTPNAGPVVESGASTAADGPQVGQPGTPPSVVSTPETDGAPSPGFQRPDGGALAVVCGLTQLAGGGGRRSCDGIAEHLGRVVNDTAAVVPALSGRLLDTVDQTVRRTVATLDDAVTPVIGRDVLGGLVRDVLSTVTTTTGGLLTTVDTLVPHATDVVTVAATGHSVPTTSGPQVSSAYQPGGAAEFPPTATAASHGVLLDEGTVREVRTAAVPTSGPAGTTSVLPAESTTVGPEASTTEDGTAYDALVPAGSALLAAAGAHGGGSASQDGGSGAAVLATYQLPGNSRVATVGADTWVVPGSPAFEPGHSPD